MKKMSKESEKRLLGALEKAADLIADGTHPTEALIKTAREAQIPAGHVHLMVNAINTGRTNAHRQAHNDVMEKSGNFPLAETDKVLAELFPDNVKTAAQVARSQAVSQDYSRSPSWVKEVKEREKQARVVNWTLTEKKHVPETDPDLPYRRAKEAIHRKLRTANESRLKMGQARERALAVAAELREYFKEAGHIAFNDVNENAELYFGKQASVVLKIAQPKRESGAGRLYHFNPAERPFTLIAAGIKAAADYVTYKREYDQLSMEAQASARELMRPFAPGPEAGKSVLGVSSLPMEKTSNLTMLLAQGLGLLRAADLSKEIGSKMPVPGASSDLERKDLLSLMDPTHDREMRNIQAEALLNDLMANDDVIRGYNPEEVVDSFNEISQLTPYASNKKAIMRDLLRRRLSGGPQAISQFEVGDTLKSQQSLQDLEKPNEGNLNLLNQLGGLPSAKTPPPNGKSVLGG